MKNGSKLSLYIIINVLVSAATILVVLFVWEWTHPQPEISPLPNPSNTVTQEPNDHDLIQPSYIPSIELLTENYRMAIQKVVGAGNLEMEYLEIVNQSEGAVDLSGWQVRDEDGNRFDFPTMILDSNGALTIHSKSGQNTVIELYWQAEMPVWQSGETVHLLDQNGNLAASYSIP